MGEETSNSTQNKARAKTTRPKAVYQWTVNDVQKWYRRHCGDYIKYENLFAKVKTAVTLQSSLTHHVGFLSLLYSSNTCVILAIFCCS